MIKKALSIAGFVAMLAAGIILLAWADDRSGAARAGTDGTSGTILQWIAGGLGLSGLLGLLYVSGLLRAIVGGIVAYRQSAPPPAAPAQQPPALDALAPPAEPPQGPVGS